MNNVFYIRFRVIIFVFLLSYLNVAAGLTPDEIVYETTQEVLNRLKIDRERLKTEPEYIQEIVRELIVPHMDFTTMAALTLGENWEILRDTKQTCFSRGFRNLLVERYAYVLLSYRNQDISYQSAKPIGEKDYVSIIQTLSRPEVKPSTLEYRIHPEGDVWKVVDLVIDDISLIRNYRKMFNKEIKQSGLAGFLNDFQECNP